MAQIKLNASTLNEELSGMLRAVLTMNVSTSSVPSVEKCAGIMISEYVDRIKKISKLLNQYSKLLEKDIEDIYKARDKIAEADQKSKKLIS